MRGIYKAAQGMIYESMRMDILANNLANADTIGYKKSQFRVTSTFDSHLDRYLERGAVPVKSPINTRLVPQMMIGNYNVNFEQGSLKETNGVFDLAIGGRGFFGIQNMDGQTVFTRDGSFTTNDRGEMINANGLLVLDENSQPIQVPTTASHIEISQTGQVHADDTEIAKLMIVDFPDQESYPLEKMGGNLFQLKDQNETPIPLDLTVEPTKIRQGFLETSNLNVVEEMIEMIQTLRNFQGYQKTIQALDDSRQKLNETARG